MTLAGAFSAALGALIAATLLAAASRTRRDSQDDRTAIARACRRTRLPGVLSRMRAAELLGASSDAAALPALSRLLGDRSADVRVAAVRALGELGDPSAIPALLRALEGDCLVPDGIVASALLELAPAAAADDRLRALRAAAEPQARSAALAPYPRGRLAA
jgi:HEAT repeat protein